MTTRGAEFVELKRCQVCDGERLRPVHRAILDFTEYSDQDPSLHGYTGKTFVLNQCMGCGFAQPEALPDLPGFFERVYDQRWSPDWLEAEFNASYKDAIFREILDQLDARHPRGAERRLLDVGAHVGRFVHLAQRDEWDADGVEVNPRTSEYAARATGRPIHRSTAQAMTLAGSEFDAVVLTDVLEHIPRPVTVLADLRRLLKPGGTISIKVPHGANQRVKESIRSKLRPGYRPSLADNMVHVNHFTPNSLRIALEKAGYTRVSIRAAPPERIGSLDSMRARVDNAVRRFVYRVSRVLPFGTNSPLAMNLQAFASTGTARA